MAPRAKHTKHIPTVRGYVYLSASVFFFLSLDDVLLLPCAVFPIPSLSFFILYL